MKAEVPRFAKLLLTEQSCLIKAIMSCDLEHWKPGDSVVLWKAREFSSL